MVPHGGHASDHTSIPIASKTEHESAQFAEERKKLGDQTQQCSETLSNLEVLVAELRGVEIDLERNRDACLLSIRADCEAVIATINTRRSTVEQTLRAEVQARQDEVRVLREATMDALSTVDGCRKEALTATFSTGWLDPFLNCIVDSFFSTILT